MKGTERTLILMKPDAVRRRLLGEILARFEQKGLAIVALKMLRMSRAVAARHYAEHKGKPFYKGLVDFITSGPLVAMVAEGVDAVAVCRRLVGATCGREAAAGTIRGDYGMSGRLNLVHASDSAASARREIGLYFTRRELVGRELFDAETVYDMTGETPL